MKKSYALLILVAISVLVLVVVGRPEPSQQASSESSIPNLLSQSFADVDFTKHDIDLNLILSGGPPKDGIPALNNPQFETLQDTRFDGTTRGILVEVNDDVRFYPFNILVWHEIVNDTIGDKPVAVTFCPLCGSSIVFERTIDGQVVEFGVSGLLYESNMIMYNRSEPTSLWSQSLGRAVAGEFTGTTLQHLPTQVLELATVKKQYPEALILSTVTGHSRDYSFYPYGDYDSTEDLLFPIQNEDKRYSAKELFYIIPYEQTSVALRIGELEDNAKSTHNETGLQAEQLKDDVISIIDKNGQELPGYYEMWFSWATHHQADGMIWDPSE